EQVLQLAEAIFRRDAATALQLLSQWYDQGLQAGELLEQLIQHWRNLMLIKCAGPAIRELPIETTVIETVRRQTEQVSLDTILAGLDVWTAAKARLRDAYQAQVLLEMAVVRLARMDELLSVGALWQHLTQGSIMAVPTAGPASPPTPADSTSGGVSRLSTPAGSGSPPSSATAPGTVKKNSDARPNATSPIGQRVIPLSPGTVAEVWAECLRRLEERFRILANHLKQAMPPQLSGVNTLVVRFAAPYNSAYEACSGNEEFARRLEETVRMVTGQPVQIRYERVPLPPAASREASPSGGVATPSAQPVASTTTSTGSPGSGDPRRHWLERPLFRKAAETLGAQIIRVDEGFQPQEPSTRMDSLAANTGTDEDNESINTAYTSNDEN
ncbi:MAG: hypothetical protein NZ703_01235, partial [Gemmataceae bacterium]|nr:hypothetical protein [Gemmataceae bacterium]